MRRFFEYDFLLLLGESSWPASSHSVQKKKVRQDLSHPGTSTLNNQSLVVCLLLPELALLGHFPDSRTMNEHPHTNPTAFQNHGQSQSATLRSDNKLQDNAVTWFTLHATYSTLVFSQSHMYFDGKEATKHTESDKRSGSYTFAKLPTIIVRSDTWLPCPFLGRHQDHSWVRTRAIIPLWLLVRTSHQGAFNAPTLRRNPVIRWPRSLFSSIRVKALLK